MLEIKTVKSEKELKKLFNILVAFEHKIKNQDLDREAQALI